MVWTKLGLTKQRMRKLQPKKLHGLHLSKRHYLIAGGAVLLTAALASSAVAKWGHSTDPVTVPEHTRIHVVLDQAVSTGTKPGHHFRDRKSTRLNSSHVKISYAVFCLK